MRNRSNYYCVCVEPLWKIWHHFHVKPPTEFALWFYARCTAHAYFRYLLFPCSQCFTFKRIYRVYTWNVLSNHEALGQTLEIELWLRHRVALACMLFAVGVVVCIDQYSIYWVRIPLNVFCETIAMDFLCLPAPPFPLFHCAHTTIVFVSVAFD